MKFLEDDILRLRAVEPSDADTMWEIETDSSQWRDNGMSAPYSRRNLREYAENYDADPIRAGQLRLVAELKYDTTGRNINRNNDTTGRTIGLVDLYDISPTGRTAFIGIYVMDQHRGNGYAARALNLMEEYARMLLNLRIVAAKVSAANPDSRSLFEKNGYTLSGRLQDWLLSGSETSSLLIYTKKLD